MNKKKLYEKDYRFNFMLVDAKSTSICNKRGTSNIPFVKLYKIKRRRRKKYFTLILRQMFMKIFINKYFWMFKIK